uniref:DNA-directed RNA polymerase n=1 Tax=Steinernema glaseri TaxID=37863 RepID=A0A1I8AJV5_9BILA
MDVRQRVLPETTLTFADQRRVRLLLLPTHRLLNSFALRDLREGGLYRTLTDKIPNEDADFTVLRCAVCDKLTVHKVVSHKTKILRSYVNEVRIFFWINVHFFRVL